MQIRDSVTFIFTYKLHPICSSPYFRVFKYYMYTGTHDRGITYDIRSMKIYITNAGANICQSVWSLEL